MLAEVVKQVRVRVRVSHQDYLSLPGSLVVRTWIELYYIILDNV